MTPAVEWSSDDPPAGGLRTLWRWRDLVWSLTARELTLRYKGSVLGVLWSLTTALLLALVYTVAFQLIIRVQIPHYSLFLLVGLLPWLFFVTSITTGSGAFSEQGHLIRKVMFPRETLVAARVAAQFVHFCLAFGGVVVPFAAWTVGPSPAMLALLPLVALQAIFVLGLSLAVATGQVYLRATRHVVELLLQLWFWATPVVYSLGLVPARWRPVALVNPMTLFVSAYRDVLIARTWPSPSLLAALAFFTVAALAGGYGVFLRGRSRLAEHV